METATSRAAIGSIQSERSPALAAAASEPIQVWLDYETAARQIAKRGKGFTVVGFVPGLRLSSRSALEGADSARERARHLRVRGGGK